MSDNQLSGDDLKNLLLSWLKKFGEEKLNSAGNPYLKITDMRTALNALAATFISKGYDYEDLKSSLLSSQIQRACTPYKYKGKLAEWRIMIDEQWRTTINDFFPETIAEAVIHEGIAKPTVALPGVSNSVFVSRPAIDKSQLKGLIIPEYTIVENDPLAFLKKGENE